MNIPILINEPSLSRAWVQAFLHTMRNTQHSPLLISTDGFKDSEPIEDIEIRTAVDSALKQHGKNSCYRSAMTIFPFKFWNRAGKPHIQEFTELYMKMYFPKLRARNSLNARGTYFERMINFQGASRNKSGLEVKSKNQLEHIINIWARERERGRRPRRSALQVSCFDPIKDHTGAVLSHFPCLQQVSFSYYDNDKSALAVNAYYPTQYIFDRAYGNYLGLCYLGYFMAHELDLQLVQFNCFIGCPELGRIQKPALKGLAETLATIL